MTAFFVVESYTNSIKNANVTFRTSDDDVYLKRNQQKIDGEVGPGHFEIESSGDVKYRKVRQNGLSDKEKILFYKYCKSIPNNTSSPD